MPENMKLNYKYPLQKSQASDICGVFIFTCASLQGSVRLTTLIRRSPTGRNRLRTQDQRGEAQPFQDLMIPPLVLYISDVTVVKAKF